MVLKATARAAFGDFQTPCLLADEACMRLRGLLDRPPRTIVEPSCGTGAFLVEAARRFPDAAALGFEINATHAEAARVAARAAGFAGRVHVRVADFFRTDWRAVFAGVEEPVLVVGNPPWVTNSDLGVLDADNAPAKSNFKGLSGMDARTGKSNFDVSEWMLLAHLDALQGVSGTVAVLCKTSVARKIVEFAHRNALEFRRPAVFRINASRHFGAAVDACFFVFSTGGRGPDVEVPFFESLGAAAACARWALREGRLVGDAVLYDRLRRSVEADVALEWRSGLKHDCAGVMELHETESGLINGLGERVDVETEVLFPLVKASELAGRSSEFGKTWAVVTQRKVGEDTSRLARSAPRAWAYLREHATAFERRKSTVYREQPEFAMFGVGPYTFAPWKVAVSALHADIRFRVIGPRRGKPTVLDDTCYFVACPDEGAALWLLAQLSRPDVAAFLHATATGRSKRVVTKDVLSLLSGAVEPQLPLFG